MFLISLSAISALGVIAGGSFWTAQSMYRITDNAHRVNVRFCQTVGGLTFGGVAIPTCP